MVDVPLAFMLVGLGLYTVLGGADFGAGLWQLTAGGGEGGARLRAHAHHAIAAVWEANHVWLIFILTVGWTAYPVFVGSVSSTLAAPLFLAGVGIILRGAAYAAHAGTRTARESRAVDSAFAVSSVLTPFTLGAAAGAIASGRVPVGNAAGALWSSWLNPTSVLIGALAVAVSGYLAAVYLAADAVRTAAPDLERRFRFRALGSGVVAGALAIAGVAVLHADSRALFDGLVSAPGIATIAISALAGLTTLGLVARRRYTPARATAALAVAAVVSGWAVAQRPYLLPGLTVTEAAAPLSTIVAVVVAVLAGAVLLFPSLALLFRLVLGGRFDPSAPAADTAPPAAAPAKPARPRLAVRLAAALFVAGFGLLNVAPAAWAHALGVICFFGFLVVGFRAIAPAELATRSGPEE